MTPSQHPLTHSPLYIRNLTSSLLELQVIEQYTNLSASATKAARWSYRPGILKHVTDWVAPVTEYHNIANDARRAPEPTPVQAQLPGTAQAQGVVGTTSTSTSTTKSTATAKSTTATTIDSTAAIAAAAQPASNGIPPFTTSPISSPQALLAATAQNYIRRQVSVQLEPFTLRNIHHGQEKGEEIKLSASSHNPDLSLRLTIAVQTDADDDDDNCSGYKECHRIDFPLGNGINSCANDTSVDEWSIVSRDFKPLKHDAQHKFTGIFISEQNCMAIYSVANLQCWMRELTDTTPLSALSIPGTHNTPTCYRALPSVRCQAVSPREQLENGIRFFDVRVQPERANDPSNATLYLVHSVFPISLTGTKYFDSLVDEIAAFLQDNPSETVIMSIKREGAGDATDEHLSKILREHYTMRDDGKLWYTSSAIPTLGQVRGRIVLLRRFRIDSSIREQENGGDGWGLEAECWTNNTIHDLHGVVCVQDFYEVLVSKNISEKISYVTDHLSCSAAAVTPLPENDTAFTLTSKTSEQLLLPPPPFYLNFLSASNFWRASCWPDKIAEKLNPAIVKYLCTRHCQAGQSGDGSTGILVCDFVGKDGNWDIVKCVVGMNSRLELREKLIARSLKRM